jgi:hypothetical protein
MTVRNRTAISPGNTLRVSTLSRLLAEPSPALGYAPQAVGSSASFLPIGRDAPPLADTIPRPFPDSVPLVLISDGSGLGELFTYMTVS